MIISKNRIKLLSGIILFLVIPIYGCGYVRPMFFPVNVEIPIDLSKAGSVAEKEFRIFFKDSYEIYLDFLPLTNDEFGDKESDDLLEFLGAWKHAPGKIIPIKLTITKFDGKDEIVIFDKKYFTRKVSSLNRYSIYRDVTVLGLDSGKYKIKIKNENEQDLRELFNTRSFLTLCYFRVK